MLTNVPGTWPVLQPLHLSSLVPRIILTPSCPVVLKALTPPTPITSDYRVLQTPNTVLQKNFCMDIYPNAEVQSLAHLPCFPSSVTCLKMSSGLTPVKPTRIFSVSITLLLNLHSSIESRHRSFGRLALDLLPVPQPF